MKKLLFMIVISIIVAILVAKESGITDLGNKDLITKNDSINEYQPKYMEVPILKDYRINMPIKEIIKWNSILLSQAITLELLEPLGYGLQISGPLALATGSSIGLVVGLLKVKLFEHRFNKGDNIRYNKPIFSQEQRLTKYTYKWDISNRIIIKKNITFWDDFGFIYSLTGWYAEGLHQIYERKFQVSLTDCYNYDNNIAFYYCINGGYSNGNYLDENFNRKTKNLFCSSGQIGLQIDFFDIFYCKFEINQDYSPFYYHLRDKGYNVSAESNYGFGFAIGTIIY